MTHDVELELVRFRVVGFFPALRSDKDAAPAPPTPEMAAREDDDPAHEPP